MGIDFTIEEKAGPKIPPMRTWESVSLDQSAYPILMSDARTAPHSSSGMDTSRTGFGVVAEYIRRITI